MSNTEYQEALRTGVCEKCGSGVHLDEEGRVACDGCNNLTHRCSCGATAES